jgi:hypothetical protein
MTRLQIELPEEIESQIHARAVAAGCATTEEYVHALILADAADPGAPPRLSFKTQEQLERFLLERVNAFDKGEMTDSDFDAIRGLLTQTVARKAQR